VIHKNKRNVAGNSGKVVRPCLKDKTIFLVLKDCFLQVSELLNVQKNTDFTCDIL